MAEPNQYTEPYDRQAPEDDERFGEPFSNEMRTIIAQWREAYPYWEKRYEVCRRDKRFAQSKQWDEIVEKERYKRDLATVTWPLIRSFYNKQLGSAIPGSVDFNLVNTSPLPSSDANNDQENDAEVKTLTGAMRFIDKQSKSGSHRTKARKDQFSGGIGWLGLDYVSSDGPEDGEIKISSPKYFDQVYIHPYFKEPDASDCEYSFEITKYPYSVAVSKYGNAIKRIKDKGQAEGEFTTFENFDDCYRTISTIDPEKHSEWIDDKNKTVTIANHHWRKKTKRTFYEFNGTIYTKDQWKEFEENTDLTLFSEKPVKTVKDGWFVEQRTISGWSVLEKKDFFIAHIPWTPVFGYTLEDGEDYTYHSIIHDGVQLQEHANWLASQHATKAGEAKTLALIAAGTLSDRGTTPTAKRGGVEFIEVDFTADGTGNAPAQLIQTPDNGSTELQQLQLTIELLREIMSTSNESSQNQVIHSAKQLSLHIQDRDSVREELDVNYRLALETHYSKVVEMIKSVYTKEDIIRVVDLDQEKETIGAEKILDEISTNYAVSIVMSPSGTVQKNQAQQLAAALSASPDPNRQSMGLIMSIKNSDLKNADQLLMQVYKEQFAKGNIVNIPQEVFQEILQDQARTGQFQQRLAEIAEPIAQQRLQQMLQDKNIQLQMATIDAAIKKSDNEVTKAGLQTQKAGVDAQAALRSDQLQLMQEGEQTKQDQLQVVQQQEQTKQDFYRTVQEFAQTQQKIAEARAKGLAVNAELIDKLINIQVPNSIQILRSVQ